MGARVWGALEVDGCAAKALAGGFVTIKNGDAESSHPLLEPGVNVSCATTGALFDITTHWAWMYRSVSF